MNRAKYLAVGAAVALVGASGAQASGLIETGDIANGAVTWAKLSKTVQHRINSRASVAHGVHGSTGSNGERGTAGPVGPAGPRGSTGPRGQQGPQGAQGIGGAQGATGSKGDKGDMGAPATVATAEVQVFVSRNGATASEWANYRAVLVNANGTTGGTFRFTCPGTNNGTGDCIVSLKANSSVATTIYPRILIQAEPIGGAPANYCEYVDGGTTQTTGSLATVPLNTTDDCDGADTGTQNWVGVTAGSHYDVTVTAKFGA